jgi:hypothetical protein
MPQLRISSPVCAGWRDGPNHADRLDRSSRVLSARMPGKKSQAKKSPSVLSVETAYELTPSEASKKTKPAQKNKTPAQMNEVVRSLPPASSYFTAAGEIGSTSATELVVFCIGLWGRTFLNVCLRGTFVSKSFFAVGSLVLI